MKPTLAPAIYGLMAEFGSSTDLVVATRAAYAAGYRKMDAYSPFPIEEASEALGFHKTRVPLIVLVGGLFGRTAAFTRSVLDQRHLLSAEYRRQAVAFVAGIHRAHV